MSRELFTNVHLINQPVTSPGSSKNEETPTSKQLKSDAKSKMVDCDEPLSFQSTKTTKTRKVLRRVVVVGGDQSLQEVKSKMPTGKTTPEDFLKLEKKLREFDFYHGFLPREDLQSTLLNPGDFLLRVSEIHESEGKVKREIILSVIPISVAGGDEEEKKKCRNVVIKRVQPGMFFCETSHTFKSVNDLITYYSKNTGTCSTATFLLKNPILMQPWEFKHSDVTVGKVLGEGAFGKVCLGTLKLKDGTTVDVAIKMTKVSAFLSKIKIREMMNEARFIRNFNHKNVVRLYGVAHDEQPLYILLELVNGGSLQEYLRDSKTKGQPVSIFEKLQFCVGAARGIEYLHLNNCIHRDIAARNCLLSSKGSQIVKITDFGLSRNGPVYKMKTSCKLPVKWLAPETISTLSFSFATDVYSWGITCFEVFADGTEPFEGMTNAQCKADVVAGKYLQMPPMTPEAVKKYIGGMVFVEAPNRVTMLEAAIEFERFSIMCEMGQLEVQMATPKSRYNILKAFKPKKK